MAEEKERQDDKVAEKGVTPEAGAEDGDKKATVEVGEEKKPDNTERNKEIRKNILQYVAFFVINALVILVLILREDKGGDRASGYVALNLFAENWHFTAIAFFCFFAVLGGDWLVFDRLIFRATGKKNVKVAFAVAAYGRYYDRLTPWSIGGEPFQMAYLYKQGKMTTGDSCAITMSRHIIRFFVTAIAVITILLASRISTNPWVMAAAIVSVLCGLIIPSFMIICCVNPKLGQKIATGIIGLLHKMKLIKDYEKMLEKTKETVNNFLSGLEYLSANKQMVIIIGLVALLELFAMNSVPYFVMRGLGFSGMSYWHVFVLCIFVSYASSFAPTPGGAGIAELSFYAIFASIIHDGLLFWAVVAWRAAVFYVPVFFGFGLQIADGVTTLVKKYKK